MSSGRPLNPISDPFITCGDNETSLKPQERQLQRGVVYTGTSANGQPRIDRTRLGVLRRVLLLKGRSSGTQTQIGAVGYATPAIVTGLSGGAVHRVLKQGGVVDDTLQTVPDALLPDGTQEFLRGDAGALIAGTDADSERRVFISDRPRPISHHRDPQAPELSMRLYDVDGDQRGIWAGEHTRSYVTRVPAADFRAAASVFSVPVVFV